MTITFEPLGQFALVDFGLFWSKIKDQYPVSETQPAVSAELESFGEFAPTRKELRIFEGIALPRAFFRNPRLGELVQLQHDRFSFNWLKSNDDDAYPHSESILEKFDELLNKFESFLAERGIGTIKPVQCELTNVNVIPLSDVGGTFVDVATLVRLPSVTGSHSNIELEHQLAGSKYLMKSPNGEPIGRVHCMGQPSLKTGSNELAFRLDLTARGAPIGQDRDGVRRFFSEATSAINAAFLANVTDAGRRFWGEKNG